MIELTAEEELRLKKMKGRVVKHFKNKDYLYILITNYLSNQLFMYFFFYLMCPFLGFIITIIISLSTIFLYLETKKISKKISYYLIPYIIYSTYALILMSTIYFINF